MDFLFHFMTQLLTDLQSLKLIISKIQKETSGPILCNQEKVGYSITSKD